MNRRNFLWGASAALSVNAAARAQGSKLPTSHGKFVHPGILQRTSDLDYMKSKILAGEDPWKSAWDKLLAEKYSSLDFKPEPVTHIVRGSYGAGKKGDVELNASMEAANSHALQWYVTRKEAHAQKALEILDAWSTTLADFSANDAMLLAGWTGGNLCNTAEILRATYAGTPADVIRRFKRMMLTVYVPLLYPFFPEANGNWDAAIMFTLLSISVFCEDRQLMDRVLHHYRFGTGNSGITRYVYPNGQCEENRRDQGHTQLGLGYFSLTALVAWNQGIDLFSEGENRLALGFEYTSRFMLGEDVFAYESISQNGRGRFEDWYEAALQHYRYEKHIEMPYTEKACLSSRPKSRRVLTLYRGEGVNTPSKNLSPTPVPSVTAKEAGAALASPTNGRGVAPGESLQEALDRASASGGVVTLAPGLHSLTATLRITSGVTLVGSGRDSILFLTPPAQGPAITNADPDLHDVVLRNFLIEGGIEPHASRDPNQDARPRHSQLAPSRGGISLVTDVNSKLKSLTLDHLTVKNCTESAVEIFGADGVHIIGCDFSGSGGAVAPGAGQHHNLKLTHVSNCEVTGSRLTDSLCGHGIALTFCRDVAVRDCELARNAMNGVRVAESQAVTITESLAEGNGGAGVAQETWMDGNLQIVVHNNKLQNNAA